MLKLKTNKKSGITLISLVVTIIVLLILAGISIMMLSGNNGILQRASDAKEETIIGQEKEQVELAYVSAAVKKLGNNVDKDDLQDELDLSIGENKTRVTDNTDNNLNVLFIETLNNYKIENGKVSKIEPLELHISNYSELLDFANAVNEGENFENYIVYLDNDIQIEDTDWIVIGTPGNRDNPGTHFSGIFEGNRHTISNISFTTAKTYNGLFGLNDGTIQNLNVVGNISGNIGIYVGLISGSNHGIIDNCSALITCDISWSGINANYLRLGGIAGTNSGSIRNCSVMGQISVDSPVFSSATGGIVGENFLEITHCKNYATMSSSSYYFGGIVGRVGDSSNETLIKQSINYATISPTFNDSPYAGGIAGILESGCIEECANKGDYIDARSSGGTASYLGGICGYTRNNTRILNCYVAGNGSSLNLTAGIIGGCDTLQESEEMANCYVCGQLPNPLRPIICGGDSTADFISNCYYNEDLYMSTATVYNATGLTTIEMKNSSFLTMLGNKFKADANNINNGYPVLAFE